MSTLTLGLAATDDALRALAAEWEALFRRVPDALAFQSPAWLLPWWDAFGTGRPRVATLRADAGQLIGLLPLYVLDEPPQRKLLLLGAGTTDYLDLLLDQSAPPDAPNRLLAAALSAAERDGLTACDLTCLPPGSPLRDTAPTAGWREAARWGEGCAVLALPAGASGLEQVVPKGKRRDLRLARHRAARAGGWTVETAAPDTLPALLEQMIRLHQERWRDSGTGIFADPRVGAFHRAAAPGLLAHGLLRLDVLRIGGRIAAAYYVLLDRAGRMLFYLSGYDRKHARESPGTILLAAMIEQALQEDRRELHFLRGGEDYKYAWGAVDQMIASRRLVPVAQ
ncbi:MAG: GNAT family N-acetyltransferase [Alphaproteobacteria bacterium]|nr:GNAT family N-acetyltransferase [Alphaproteobacteria bacterium]